MYKHVAGQLRILMIEDRYGKWTLPKGKQEPGEALSETALREIREETGIEGDVVTQLMTIRYQFHPSDGTRQVDKEVHYYLVKSLSGKEKPQLEEINRLEWLSRHEVWERQNRSGYDNNKQVLEKAFLIIGSGQ